VSAKLPAELSSPPEGGWHWCGTLVFSPIVSALVNRGTNGWEPGESRQRQSGVVKFVTLASPSTSITFFFISFSVELLDEDDEALAFEVDFDDDEDEEDEVDEGSNLACLGQLWFLLVWPVR